MLSHVYLFTQIITIKIKTNGFEFGLEDLLKGLLLEEHPNIARDIPVFARELVSAINKPPVNKPLVNFNDIVYWQLN